MRRRAGFTLVEVVITMVILTGFILVITRMFWGSQKQSAGSEARFSAAVLAQLVAERMRSEATLNPALFKKLLPAPGQKWTVSGRVVDGIDGVPVAPFFQYLFARGTADLYTAPNQGGLSPTLDTLKGATGPLDGYRDYRVEITLADDDPPAGGPDAALMREMVKRLTVTVARATAAGEDPAGFTLRTRLLTPLENLSMPALDQLFNNFEGARLDEAYEEFYEQVASNPFFSSQYLTPQARDLLADCYICMGTINTEAYLSDGRTIAGNLVITTSKPSMSMSTWVQQLTQPQYYAVSLFKKELAKINTQRLEILFDAFKKVSPVLADLLDKHDAMLPQVQSIETAMAAAEAAIVSMDGSTQSEIATYRSSAATLSSLQSQPATTGTSSGIASAQASMDAQLNQILANVNSYNAVVTKQSTDLSNAIQFINTVKAMNDFFTQADYRGVFDRLKDYPPRFTQTLKDIEKPLTDFCDQADGPRPYERVIAAQKLVEVLKLRQLDDGKSDPAALAHLKQLADQNQTTLAPLADYLRGSEVHDYTLLEARNTRFLVALQQMRKLAKQYTTVVKNYDAGGAIQDMLALYTRIQPEISLASPRTLAQITRNLKAAGAPLDGTAALTPAQIQAAIAGVTLPPPLPPATTPAPPAAPAGP